MNVSILDMLGRLWTLLLLAAPLYGQQAATASIAHNRPDISRTLGFETSNGVELPQGWHGSPPGTFAIDTTMVHTGHFSVRLDRKPDTPGAFTVLTTFLPVDFTGKQIQLRGYLRTDGVGQFVGLWLREDGPSGMLALDNMQEQGVRGTADWKEYTVSLPLHPGAQKLYFGVLLSGPGMAWADDLQLLVDGKPFADAPSAPERVSTILDRDHEFDRGSKLLLNDLTPLQVDNLATLGRVWGFLKYHHPAVTAGQRQWDYDLLRILPGTLKAHDRSEADSLLVRWIDRLGQVAECHPCAELSDFSLALAPDLDWIKDTGSLGKQLTDQLQRVYANRPVSEQFYVSLAPQVGNPVFARELAYSDIHLPDPGFQLLALFRFWNIVQYWYPYRDVSGQSWPQVLHEFIPRVALAKNREEYELAMLAFAAKVNDTHANLWNSLAVRPPTGECRLPVNMRFIEGKAVVTSYASSTVGLASGLRPGDILDQIDGSSVQELVRAWAPFYADSNEAARLRDIASALTNGNCGQVNLMLARAGSLVRLTSTRVAFGQLDGISYTHDLPGPTFRLLSKDVAYLKLSSVKAADIPGDIKLAGGTKGLIVDIRNYPAEFVPFVLGSLLIGHHTPFARFTGADLSNPGAFRWHEDAAIEPAQPQYAGKVVILVDEVSQSQAEYTDMALRAATNSITVGSQTAGADGNVSPISLPGRLSTMISGIGVFYPNKQPTQRIGVHVDVLVTPTIRGTQDGRDEVLEQGIRQILGPRISDVEVQQLSRPLPNPPPFSSR